MCCFFCFIAIWVNPLLHKAFSGYDRKLCEKCGCGRDGETRRGEILAELLHSESVSLETGSPSPLPGVTAIAAQPPDVSAGSGCSNDFSVGVTDSAGLVPGKRSKSGVNWTNTKSVEYR